MTDLSATHRDRVRKLFFEAVEAPAGERAALVERHARDLPPEARAALDDLLSAHNGAGGFLAEPTIDMAPAGSGGGGFSRTVDAPAAVGPYKIVRELGHGGFGTVYLAEQERPIRRRVAVKLINPGMDTRQVVNRFQTERQALALMDHPNIARVLDAGTTDAGRPFFVMELVDGPPITTYCKTRGLPVRRRLELFVSVCRAVQHAHQKGVIHRDLKPTNVLVAEHDRRPVPKVIDFGVARALWGRLTDTTVADTERRDIIGTPQYMSPEQAATRGDVDTRADVYGLGVLMYELLTDLPPFDPERLRRAPLPEMLRVIREEDPPPPPAACAAARTSAPGTRPTAGRRAPPRRPGTARRRGPSRPPCRTGVYGPSPATSSRSSPTRRA